MPFDQAKADKLQAEAVKRTEEQGNAPKPAPKILASGLRAELERMMATLPDDVPPVPYEKTPEGERAAEFRQIIDEQFDRAIDPTKIRNRAAFDKAMAWDGTFPGPQISGTTGFGKSFVAWQLLRRLYVKENRTFVWFSAKRLMVQMEKYEGNDCLDDFFRVNDLLRVWFIDDLDKINWDFESQANNLFTAIDWVYRKKKPCIVTTNRDRAWWKEKMGDAFVRRLFTDAFFHVEFR